VSVPTVFRAEGFRFFFFSNEGTEPPHVHVEKGDGYGKWWLDPLRMAYSKGFGKKEERRIRELVFAHRMKIQDAWHEHFGS